MEEKIYHYKIGDKIVAFDCPPWRKLLMSPKLMERLPSKKSTTHTMFYSKAEGIVRCFNATRDDSHSLSRVAFSFDIPLERLSIIKQLIKKNWPVPSDPFAKTSKIPKECKFNRHDIAPLIIAEFGLGVDKYKFFQESIDYNQPYYDWPMQIFQVIGFLRFGRKTWRLH